jgi:HAD superfamily hydrolase (TIGR01509 family)
VRRKFVAANGGRWRDDAAAAMIGMRSEEWSRYIHDELGVDLPPAEIAERVINNVVERIRGVPPLPGASDALARLAGAFRLGLATSAAMAVAQTVLEQTGWRELFEVVVSADEVSRGKPAPDVYLRALALMHADASHTAAVEDSANGIRAGYAAKLAVVAIPNHEFPPDAAALALASRVIPNLAALDVELIRELW